MLIRAVAALAAVFAFACAHTSSIDPLFEAQARPDRPGCAVAVARGGETVLSRAYGLANLEHRVPNTPETIFEAGSVAKQFTAAALVMLEKQGKLSLDDRARKYIPELPEVADRVTLRHMLNHTSGLRDWGVMAEIAGWPRGTRAHTHRHVLDIVSRQTALNYEPGDRYSYNNSGYNLAAIVAERVSGKPLPQLTRELFFAPIGMTASSWRDDYTRVVPRRATAYSRGDDGQYHVDMHPENIYGNCCLMTTVGDLLKWNAYLDREPEFARAMERQGVLTSGATIEYAHALTVRNWRGTREVAHTGSTGGYRAFLARYPERRLSVALLCNDGEVSPGALGRRVVTEIERFPDEPEARAVTTGRAGLYRDPTTNAVIRFFEKDGKLRTGFGEDGPVAGERFSFDGDKLTLTSDNRRATYERVEPVQPAAADLQQYAGDYVSEEAGVTYRLFVEGARLRFELPQGTARPLEPTYRDGFRAGSGTLVHFTRDASGRIDGFDLKAAFDMNAGTARVERLRFSKK